MVEYDWGASRTSTCLSSTVGRRSGFITFSSHLASYEVYVVWLDHLPEISVFGQIHPE